MMLLSRAVRSAPRWGRSACWTALGLVWLAGVVARAEPQPMSSVKLDERQFQIHWGPGEDDTPGALKYGGYCHRDVAVTKTRYRVEGPYSGEASVEVVHHDAGYRYALHDLLGYVRALAGYSPPGDPLARATNGDEEAAKPEERAKFVDWTESPGAVGRIVVCVQSENPTEFAAAWFSEVGGKQTTIIIRCEDLPGWPVSLIDKYLAEYPSTLTSDEPWLTDWAAADLAKWVDLLRSRRHDEIVLQAATFQLREYKDQQAFGIFEARRHRNDPAALGRELDKVVWNIQTFVREHPEYQVKSGTPDKGKGK